MHFQVRRLRRGEMLASVAGLILLVDLFAVSWYTVSAGAVSASANGWDALTVTRWFVLVAVAAAFALAWAQATHAAPALPSSLSVIATVLALIAAIILVFRVLLTLPGPDAAMAQTGADAGAYIGLLARAGHVRGCPVVAARGGSARSRAQRGDPDRPPYGPGPGPSG